MNKLSFLQTTLNGLGHIKVARACSTPERTVTRQVVKGWVIRDKLPFTEHLPIKDNTHTRFANVIARMAGCKKENLL